MEINALLEKQKNLLRYWRASIKNKPLLDFKVSDAHYHDCQIEKSILKNGHITKERAEELFKINKRLLLKIKKDLKLTEEDNVEEEYVLPVMIAPFLYKKKHEQGDYKHTEKRHFIHPVWIYAYLDPEGVIFNFYPCLLPPWIAREYLNPVYKHDNSFIIGQMSDYDSFLDQRSLIDLDNSIKEEQTTKISKIYWKSLYQFSVDMLDKVSQNLSGLLDEDGYFDSEKGLLIPADDSNTKNYSVNLLKLLDSLESENKGYSPLLSRYLNLNKSSEKLPLSTIEQLKYCAPEHLGQITNAFPLAKSQRIALHHLLMMEEEGEILAINGPPGTGKTTLIQSIIASLWSKAAIDDKRPPIIVVSSTNNRAIQNVIDNFAMVPVQKEDALSKRWINNLSSFGLYLINNPKGNYQYCKYDFSGTLKEIEDNNILQNKKYFLDNFNFYFNLNILSVIEAKSILHKKILKLHEILTSGLKLALNYKEILGRHPKLTNKESINLKLVSFKNKLISCEQEVEKLRIIEIDWKKIKNKTIWQVTSFLHYFLSGFFEKFKTNKMELFLLEKRLAIKADEILIEDYIKRKKNYHLSNSARLKHLINACEEHLKKLVSAREKWEEWKKEQQAEHLDIKHIYTFDAVLSEGKENISEFLDTKIRYLLFQYSVHYWEARWLIEIFENYTNNDKDGTNKSAKINAYQRMAMLTPCFITTMQSGPGFFTYKITEEQDQEFMKNTIDLLIIDEAGQVNPALSAGMMALSKKACVIGDNFQLPPLQEVGGAIDVGNLKHYKIISKDEEYSDIVEFGIRVSGDSKNKIGSVMKIAQNTCLFQEPIIEGSLNERGLFLTEHRRCVPEIISYCNDFFYKGKMIYQRASNKDRPYPALGYAHIPGIHEEAGGSSKINKIEAWSIVKWLVSQKENFKNIYPNSKLEEIFGIITPFNAQATLFKDLLEKEKITFSSNNVGTVHTFQGGEFPIIIFSPVYSHEKNYKKYFFDSEETMLNVAVSRAKDHFFVFGDMDIFDTDRRTPSGFLAKHLFSEKENELPGVYIIRQSQYKNLTIKHINSLEGHQNILNEAFKIAKDRIICISPWITSKALELDGIEALIKKASIRKISVIIYTDFSNNFKTDKSRNSILNCLKLLKNAGAEIRVIHNIHAKTLVVDNQFLVEGSFNWLSASRDRPNYEASICSTGMEIEKLIKNIMQTLEERPLIDVKKIQHNFKFNHREQKSEEIKF